MDQISGDCGGIDANTTKMDMVSGGWACKVGEIQAVHVTLHQKADCSDTGMSLILESGSCMMGGLELSCKEDSVTWKIWDEEDKAGNCKAGTEANSNTFNDDKCHSAEALNAGGLTTLSYGAMAVVVMVLSAIY